jgi:Flp pilus assembly protein TadG
MKMREEQGQAIVLTAVSMSLLMGFLALAVDVGLLFRERRQMQIAADAAAVAAALDLKYNNSATSARTAGQNAAVANGVSSTTYITINPPPLNGPYAGQAGYAEAIVQQPTSTFFMKLFRFDLITVYSRAVAGTGVNNGCIWALGSSGTGVSVSGSGSVTAQNCNIYDDSSASNALSLSGSGSVTGRAIGIVGGYSRTGSGGSSPNPPMTGMKPAADPLNLTSPTVPGGTCSGSLSACNPNNSGSGNMTLSPGTYTSITNSGSGQLTLNAGNYVINGAVSCGAGVAALCNSGSGALVLGAGNYTIHGNFVSTGSGALTIGSGQYIVTGNLALTASGPLAGSNVTFYTEGGTTISGSGSMNLTAPTSGAYNGILLYQPSGDASAISIAGAGGATIRGIVYAPTAPLSLSGSGSMNISTDLIVGSLNLSGSGSITDTNYAVVTNTGTALSKIVMVE